MNRKEITAIALKCFSIYIITQLIISIPVLTGICLKLGYYGNHETPKFILISITFLSIIFGLGVAYFLWRFTDSLFSNESSPNNYSSELGIRETVRIILCCMGIFFAINGIIQFPKVFVDYQISKNNDDLHASIFLANIISTLLQILFGYLLTIRTKNWFKFIFK